MPTRSNVIRYIFIFHMVLISMANAQPKNPDFVVAADGSGDFIKVQDAIHAVPSNKSTRTIIFIKPGTYKERIRVPADKKNLKLVGESYENTILTYDDHAKLTKDYASTRIYADDFYAEKLTFQNTIDSRKGGLRPQHCVSMGTGPYFTSAE
jgi:pectinesterase